MRTGLALAALLAANPALGETAPPTISVNGEAQVSVAPDLAQIDGGVTTEAKTAREASEANNKAMAAILPALKAAGITKQTPDPPDGRIERDEDGEPTGTLHEGAADLVSAPGA